jgi:hypothetical protein
MHGPERFHGSCHAPAHSLRRFGGSTVNVRWRAPHSNRPTWQGLATATASACRSAPEPRPAAPPPTPAS